MKPSKKVILRRVIEREGRMWEYDKHGDRNNIAQLKRVHRAQAMRDRQARHQPQRMADKLDAALVHQRKLNRASKRRGRP